MATELAVNPNTPHILVGKNQESLYFHNNPDRMHSILAESILLETIDAKFFTYQNAVDRTEVNDDYDVMHWFQKQQMKYPTLKLFTYINHYITPLKNEN